MKSDWVIDILKDIRQFSEQNGMLVLAEQLDDAIFIAATEIGARAAESGTVKSVRGNPRGSARAFADNEVH
jgi:hypothetical protein